MWVPAHRDDGSDVEWEPGVGRIAEHSPERRQTSRLDAVDVLAADGHDAGIRAGFAGKETDERGLSRSIRSQEAEMLTGPDIEPYAFQLETPDRSGDVIGDEGGGFRHDVLSTRARRTVDRLRLR